MRVTAAKLFRQHGYSSATMDLIADTVGLNKGTLYHYYDSKSAILFELLSDQLDATLDLVDKVPADGPPTARLRELVRLEVERVASNADEVVVFFQELPWMEKNLSDDQVADLRGRIDTYRRSAQQILADGIESGEFRPFDITMIHYAIVGIMAYVPNWFTARSGRKQSALVDEIAEFVVRGVVQQA